MRNAHTFRLEHTYPVIIAKHCRKILSTETKLRSWANQLLIGRLLALCVFTIESIESFVHCSFTVKYYRHHYVYRKARQHNF